MALKFGRQPALGVDDMSRSLVGSSAFAALSIAAHSVVVTEADSGGPQLGNTFPRNLKPVCGWAFVPVTRFGMGAEMQEPAQSTMQSARDLGGSGGGREGGEGGVDEDMNVALCLAFVSPVAWRGFRGYPHAHTQGDGDGDRDRDRDGTRSPDSSDGCPAVTRLGALSLSRPLYHLALRLRVMAHLQGRSQALTRIG